MRGQHLTATAGRTDEDACRDSMQPARMHPEGVENLFMPDMLKPADSKAVIIQPVSQ